MERTRSRGSNLPLLISALIAIAALVVGAIALHKILVVNQIEIVTGLFQNLPAAVSPSQTDTTLVVIACTNNTVSGTNNVIKDGKVMLANTCGTIEDNTCQEHVCLGTGRCARRIVAGGECAGDAQCVDLYGPGYVCDISSCLCEVMVPVNGSMYTNSLVCNNTGTMSVVVVMDAQCPMPGQVLTAIDSSSADWEDPNREIPCATGDVVVSNATCPTTGQVLTATGPGIADWEDPNREIPCDTGDVIVSNATCPIAGQVLTATGPGTATWQNITSSDVTTETISGTVDWVDIWASDRTSTYDLQRVGTIVTLRIGTIGTATAIAGGFLNSNPSNFIPASYRPANIIYFYAPIVDNGVAAMGQILINFPAAGGMAFSATITGAGFSGSGTTGVNFPVVLTWSTTS